MPRNRLSLPSWSLPENGDSPELNPALPDHLRADYRREGGNGNQVSAMRDQKTIDEWRREGVAFVREVADEIAEVQRISREQMDTVTRIQGIAESE
jgi:hypothetical protein